MKRSKIFYGWWIVAAGALVLGVYGGVYLYGFSIFFNPLIERFGWSRAALSGAFSVSRLETGLFGPLGGWLVDKYGPRVPMFIGTLLMGAGFLLLTQVNSLTSFYLIFLCLIAAGAGIGAVNSVTTVVGKWFIRRRTLATGLIISGVGLGGLIVPALAWIVTSFGLEVAYVIAGLTILAVGLPASFIMRSEPEKYGMLPDGNTIVESIGAGAADQRAQSSTEPGDQPRYTEVNFTGPQAVKTRAFWLLGVAFGMRQMTVSSIAVHQIPFLVDKGFSLAEASAMLGLLAVLSVPGRILMGWLGDKYDKRYLLMGTLAMIIVSLIVFINVSNVWHVLLFLAIYSPAYGGGGPLMTSMRGEYFGRRHFGTIQGLNQWVQIWGTLIGPIFAGVMYDTTKSYNIAFLSFAAAGLVGILLTYQAKKPAPPKEYLRVDAGESVPAA
ncbi:MAG: MFS transporter [Dehalococcoidia bacterium]|nr:MFS transporter [Dehalococcoidia bacterium]